MSALRFTKARNKKGSNTSCHVETCSRSGSQWMWLIDYRVGRVCGGCAARFQRVWDDALDTDQEDDERVAA